MPVIHFQSIYRYCDLVISVPLCGPVLWDGETVSPRRDEITCIKCLQFLMRLKESE